jgi:hypothetical protein
MRENLLQMMRFQSQVLEFYNEEKPLECKLIILSIAKKVTATLPCWHDSERGVFSEQGKAAVKEKQVLQETLETFLFRCHVNVATSP